MLTEDGQQYAKFSNDSTIVITNLAALQETRRVIGGGIINKGTSTTRYSWWKNTNKRSREYWATGMKTRTVVLRGAAYPFEAAKWTHVSMVVKDAQRSYFVNGVKLGTSTTGKISPNNSPLDIGRDVYGILEYMIGSFDELRVYSRALTDDEIKNLASN